MRQRIHLVVSLGLLFASLPGCTMKIRGPQAPEQPVRIFVADYGQHASLILPRSDEAVSEFAYGEWGWFALGRQGWYRALPAIAVPTPGAIGTRALRVPPEASRIWQVLPVEHLHTVEVERADVAVLLERFDTHFAAEAENEVFNADLGLRFVPYPVPYCLFCQCNSLVVNWLRELGCSVSGLSPTARFEVVDQSSSGTE